MSVYATGSTFLMVWGSVFDATMTANSIEDRKQTGKSGKSEIYMDYIKETLLGYKEKKRVMIVDNRSEECHSFLTTIAIGRRFAGSYHLTPNAIADDGLLDICDIKPLSLFKRLDILMKVPQRHSCK